MSSTRTARAVLHRLLQTPTARPCQHLLRRTITQSTARYQTTTSTSTAFQSYSLPSKPPTPPRNEPIPETSIAGPKPSAPRAQESEPTSSLAASQAAANPVAIAEKEAQTSKPVASAAPPKRKLRPRKAAIKLTSTAVEHLRALLDQPDPKLIKIGVRNRGCSGLAYDLQYVDKPGMFDEEVVQDGVKVLIDSKALFSIIGSEMDWVEDKLNQRFVFHNPNIKEECGCGESFMV